MRIIRGILLPTILLFILGGVVVYDYVVYHHLTPIDIAFLITFVVLIFMYIYQYNSRGG
jgi:hypothetical protein